jgi:hypothetical protein
MTINQIRNIFRSGRQHGVRRRSADARLLELRVRILPDADVLLRHRLLRLADPSSRLYLLPKQPTHGNVIITHGNQKVSVNLMITVQKKRAKLF